MTLETLQRAAWGRLKTQAGAFDLPSIMIGVAVVAILTIGVLAAIFGVIPWAQDRAAQQDLGAVHTAEGVAYAKDGGFMDTGALVTAGWLSGDTGGELEARADAKGECYVAVNTSKTGKEFIVSSAEPTPRESTGIDKWCDGSPLTFDAVPIMVSTWNTNAADTCREITLPINSLTGTVDWGDGATDAKTTHVYADNAGMVKITVNGTFPAWGGGGGSWADSKCLVSVDRWGETKTTNLYLAFNEADNLKHVEAIPSSTTNLDSAFRLIDSNFTLGKLNTANATTMLNMFASAKTFDQPLNFDTKNVTDMMQMFHGARALNSPLTFTDTSKVKNMGRMFNNATAFDQSLNFDTINVTDMMQMFYDATAFDSPLTFTDTSNVTDMGRMFHNATAFDHDISGWNVDKVTSWGNFDIGATAWKAVNKPKFP